MEPASTHPRPARRAANAVRAALACGMLLLLGSPGATETPAAPGQGDASHEDVRRFCSNIADAARDQRHALQVAELETLRGDIDRRIETLEARRAEYEEWLRRRNDFLARAEENLVGIYARMRPDAAAERLAEVPAELAASILMKIGARQAGIILNEMDLKAAASLTAIMASATRRQDPT